MCPLSRILCPLRLLHCASANYYVPGANGPFLCQNDQYHQVSVLRVIAGYYSTAKLTLPLLLSLLRFHNDTPTKNRLIKPLAPLTIDQRRWKGGTIEPHPTENALIVNYKLEAAVFSEPDDPMLEQKKVSLSKTSPSHCHSPLAFLFNSVTLDLIDLTLDSTSHPCLSIFGLHLFLRFNVPHLDLLFFLVVAAVPPCACLVSYD